MNKRISDEALLVHIKAIHAEVKQEYGWPKRWKELVARGIRVGKERVRKLMQRHGIKARGKRKFVVTTDSKHNLPIAPNLLERNFTPEAPNQVWTSDITYIATDEGWLYLTGVIDLFSPGGGLEHEGQHADQCCDRCLAYGMVQTPSGTWTDLPFRPWQPVLQP